jgi:hypothetical protein
MNDTVIKRFDTVEQFTSVCTDEDTTAAHIANKPENWDSWTSKMVTGEFGAGEGAQCSDIRNGVVTYTILADKALSDLQRYRDQADSMNKTALMKKYQNRISEFNQKKISNYDSDIMTTRRQVQISVNEFKRRENNIFILKTFFVYLLICMIPLLLSSSMGNNMIPRNISLIILVVITLLFSIIFLRNLLNSISRSLINYDIINYDADQEAGSTTQSFDGDLTVPTIQLLLLRNKGLLEQKAKDSRCGLTEEEIKENAIRDQTEMQEWLEHIGEEIDIDNENDYNELMNYVEKIRTEGVKWKNKGYDRVGVYFNNFAQQVENKAVALNK